MKLKLLIFLVYTLAMVGLAFPQTPNITFWKMNTTGHQAQYYNSSNTLITLSDSSDVQEVCYNTDTIYVRANSLGSFIMGPWPGDPFTAAGQNYAYIFPRNPTYPSSTHMNLPTGMCGLWINGVAIYTAGDGKSYKSSTGTNANNGDGLWNTIAWVAHINEMDDGGGHPDPNQVYHNHSNPYQLYDSSAKTVHSPIIGWAFDGFPIYGPFGYTSATDATSAIKRMTVSYQLRNITDRNSTSPAGPAINSTFPLGTYIEDYEYVSALGDLDEYNGRWCVTPEYPSGTYAYFLGTNSNGTPTYPNIVAKKFYGGNGFVSNFGASGGNASKPKSGRSCYEPTATRLIEPFAAHASIAPNPSQGSFNLTIINSSITSYIIYNMKGEEVQRGSIDSKSEVISLQEGNGIYLLYLLNGNTAYKERIVVY
jgi:hypothetical protein